MISEQSVPHALGDRHAIISIIVFRWACVPQDCLGPHHSMLSEASAPTRTSRDVVL